MVSLTEARLHDLGTSEELVARTRRIASMRAELDDLLAAPVSRRQFSARYPTELGRIAVPDCEGTGARAPRASTSLAGIRWSRRPVRVIALSGLSDSTPSCLSRTQCATCDQFVVEQR